MALIVPLAPPPPCVAVTEEGRCRRDGRNEFGPVTLCWQHFAELEKAIERALVEQEIVAIGEIQAERHAVEAEVRRLRRELNQIDYWLTRHLATAFTARHRKRVIERDERRCSYCGEYGDDTNGPDGRTWALDHVVPIRKGGKNTLKNLALACATCNSRKNTKSAEDFIAELKGDL